MSIYVDIQHNHKPINVLNYTHLFEVKALTASCCNLQFLHFDLYYGN